MGHYIPNDYKNLLSLMETEVAIKLAKDSFENKLSKYLGLTRVSAPLFVNPNTGLNDDLNGVESAVSFKITDINETVEIVHSLAKWKRMALGKYKFTPETGLYTDMNAIRRDEELDNLHSVYVDQWDWEMVITNENRNLQFLKDTVLKVVKSISETKKIVNNSFPLLQEKIEENVYFITTEDLLQKYPDLSPKQREHEICKEYKTVFIIGVGGNLSNGKPHDLRAPDYDDWTLNGDILIWHQPLSTSIEISSMGIRVDKDALIKQLEITNHNNRLNYDFHKNLINENLPLSIGGGIGQSRLCLLLLEKIHIGEVQVSTWDQDDLNELSKNNINIL